MPRRSSRPAAPEGSRAAPWASGSPLLSVSSKGELALLKHPQFVYQRLLPGRSRAAPNGGAPREVVEGVREADWSPDGRSLAVVRGFDGEDRLSSRSAKYSTSREGYSPTFDSRRKATGSRSSTIRNLGRRGASRRGSGRQEDLMLAGSYWGEHGLAWSPSAKRSPLFGGPRLCAFSFEVRAVTLTNQTRVAASRALEA